MNELSDVAPAFVEMAHRIVWCSVATVDSQGRPRTRILHPFWQWDGSQLVGWVGTSPTPAKRSHLDHSPFASVSYWSPNHDSCVADCRASLRYDDETRTMVWELFRTAPEPVGYDPAIVPNWGSPTSNTFVALRLEPWRLRVFPGTLMFGQGGAMLKWREGAAP